MTLVQLSEHCIVNMDQITVLRCDAGQWLVFFQDQAHACQLSEAEAEVLRHYLQKHTSRLSYTAVRREQNRRPWQEPVP
jgi:hypothetical protein